MRIYIAGPYSADTSEQKRLNILRARNACADLYRKGHTPFCPHTMTAWFDYNYPDIPKSRYLETDLEWLGLCDAVLLLPGWEGSEGAQEERLYAIVSEIYTFYSLDEVPDANAD